MRVLFVVMPATAHLYPSVPLAWALLGAGHEVRVASHPDLADGIRAAGLTPVPLGEVVDLGELMRSAAADRALDDLTEALAIGDDRNLRNAIRYYQLAAFSMHYPTGSRTARRAGPLADDLIAFARSWRPDLVLWDPLSFPAPIAARACGAAHARIQYGLDYTGWMSRRCAGSELPGNPLAEAMAPELDRLGLEFDEELLVGQWTVDLLPQGMRMPLDLRYLSMRRVPYNGAGALPGWLREPPSRPRVCLTLGASTRKFLALDGVVPLRDLLELPRSLDIELVATLTPGQLETIGELPEGVHAIDYIPLDVLLPTCSAVIHHGGGGTFANAVAHRVPQLVPGPGEGGDRVAFARFVHEQGAGLMLERAECSAERLREEVARLLEEPSFRAGVDALHTGMLATPAPTESVAVLERLTEQHRG